MCTVVYVGPRIGSGGGGPRIAATNTTGDLPVTTDGSSGGPRTMGATPTGKLRELQSRLHPSQSNVAQAVQGLQTENKSSNLGFYGMILGYIVISYLFS